MLIRVRSYEHPSRLAALAPQDDGALLAALRSLTRRSTHYHVMAGLGPKSAFADFGMLETELGQARVPAIHAFGLNEMLVLNRGSPGQARG
jgi:hypothetical protein